MTPDLKKEMMNNRIMNNNQIIKSSELSSRSQNKTKVGVAPNSFDPFAIGGADKNITETSILE